MSDDDKQTDDDELTMEVVWAIVQACVLPFLSSVAMASGDIMNNQIVEKHGSKQAGIIYENMNVLLFVGAFVSNIITECVAIKTTNQVLAADAMFCVGFATFLVNNPGVRYIARFLTGMSYGITARVVPVYLSMVGPMRHRGTITGMYGVFTVLGLIFGTFLDIVADYYILSLLVLAGMAAAHALVVGCALRISYHSPEATAPDITFMTMMTNRAAYKSLFIIAVYTTAHNFTGVNQIIFNSSVIFGDKNQNLRLLMAYVFSLVLTFLTAYLIDWYGRKPLSILSGVVVAGVCLAFYYTWHQILFAFMFMLGYSLGLNNFPFVLVGEIFPVDYVRHGSVFMASVNWITSVASILMMGSTTPNYDTGPYMIDMSFMIGFVLVVVFFYKETKNRPPAFQ